MVKTSISPPPPERPDGEARRHLDALEAIVKARSYPRQRDQASDLMSLRLLRRSLVPDVPNTYSKPRDESAGGEGGLFGGVFGARSSGARRRSQRRSQADPAAESEPKKPSPGLTQLWQQVISEVAVEHRALGMLLAQQSLLVSLQAGTALVMVKKMWLPSVRRDSGVIERELRAVLGRKDLRLELKAATTDAADGGEG